MRGPHCAVDGAVDGAQTTFVRSTSLWFGVSNFGVLAGRYVVAGAARRLRYASQIR